MRQHAAQRFKTLYDISFFFFWKLFSLGISFVLYISRKHIIVTFYICIYELCIKGKKEM